MDVKLVILKEDGQTKEFRIVNRVTVIGRGADSDLQIPLGMVSRKHCMITFDEDAVAIRDLGSGNGTYHNKKRVRQETPLKAGDMLTIGPVIFTVVINGKPATIRPKRMTVLSSNTGKTGSTVAPAPGKPKRAPEFDPIPMAREIRPAERPAPASPESVLPPDDFAPPAKKPARKSEEADDPFLGPSRDDDDDFLSGLPEPGEASALVPPSKAAKKSSPAGGEMPLDLGDEFASSDSDDTGADHAPPPPKPSKPVVTRVILSPDAD